VFATRGEDGELERPVFPRTANFGTSMSGDDDDDARSAACREVGGGGGGGRGRMGGARRAGRAAMEVMRLPPRVRMTRWGHAFPASMAQVVAERIGRALG